VKDALGISQSTIAGDGFKKVLQVLHWLPCVKPQALPMTTRVQYCDRELIIQQRGSVSAIVTKVKEIEEVKIYRGTMINISADWARLQWRLCLLVWQMILIPMRLRCGKVQRVFGAAEMDVYEKLDD